MHGKSSPDLAGASWSLFVPALTAIPGRVEGGRRGRVARAAARSQSARAAPVHPRATTAAMVQESAAAAVAGARG
jgi:hypothetical protein